MKTGYVYILFNEQNGTLYTGVTSDLIKRIYQHKQHQVKGFSARYNVVRLGYYEDCGDIVTAIEREKQIKGGSRLRKLELIEADNPNWNDLYDEIVSN
jgi:putative endonuclease